MEIRHSDNGKKGMFYVETDAGRMAEMVYVWAGPEKMIIEHTDVDDSLKGRGIGKQLFLSAVQFARDKQIRILPLCPFANAMFKKFGEYRDVL